MKPRLHFCTYLRPRAGFWHAACVFIVCPCLAVAQTDTSKTLKEVNIRSAAAPQLQTLTPAQVITQQDFIRTNSFTVADAVRNFAGVNVRDYGGIGGLKTMSVRSLGANHTAVLYDGVQINDAQNGQIDLSKFNLTNIREIALYNAQPDNICMPARTFAAASVLDIKTVTPNLTPQHPTQITAGIKGGSFGLVNPYLQWQQRLSNRWSFIANGYTQHANGRYKFREENDGSDTLAIRRNTDVKIYQVDGSLYWTKNDSNKFHLQINYYNADRALPGPNILYASYDGQRLYNRDLFIQSGYRYTSDNNWRLLVNSKVSQYYLRFINPTVPNNKGGIDERYTMREAYQSVALAYKPVANLEFSYSGDAAITDVRFNTFTASPTRTSLYNVLAGDFTTGRLRLQANVLHTYITETVNKGTAANARSAYTPAFIATVQPFGSANFHVRAFYKSIFRAPTLAEQYYFAIAPRPLRPEYVKQYNLGAAYSKAFDGMLSYLSISADGYYNKVKDKIIFLPVRSPETPSVINLGAVDIRGLDVNLKTRLQPAANWSSLISATYTYQRAKNVTDRTFSYYGNQIQYTPRHSAAVNASVQHKAIGINYNYILSSSRYDGLDNDAQTFMPTYSIHDCSFTYNFTIQGRPVFTAIELNNLLDKNYSVIRSYPMPGRSVRLTFQITI